MPRASTRTLKLAARAEADELADVARLRLGQLALLVEVEDANVAVTLKRILDFDMARVEPAEQEALGVERDDAAAGLHDEAPVVLRSRLRLGGGDEHDERKQGHASGSDFPHHARSMASRSVPWLIEL